MAHVAPEMNRSKTLAALLLAAVSLAFPGVARAVGPDAQPIEKVYKDVREAERYQLKIADQYYRDQNYAVAASEYEKFLSLYEASVGAPYVQLRWSHCQVELRKVNTAIRDGYQSLVDYWPDSPEAVVARLCIGRAYRDSGETKKAKKAYAELIQAHPNALSSVYAKLDLVEMAQQAKDVEAQAAALQDLVYQTKCDDPKAAETLKRGAQELATFSFSQGKFVEGSKAIETAFDPTQRAYQVWHFVRGPVHQLTGVEATKADGERVAEEAGKYIRALAPQDFKEPPQKQAAYQHFDWIAEIEYYARRYDKQLAIYQEMLKLFGEEAPTFERVASWHRTQQKYDDELGVYNQMLAKLGPSDRTFGLIAAWHRDRKQYAEAQAVYGRFQDQVEGQRQLGHMARHYWGNHDLAIQTYQGLTQLDPNRSADYQWEIGECLRAQGKFKEAIRVFALCESKAPSHIDRIAQCHRDLKEWDEAVLMYKQEATYKGAESHSMFEVARTYEQAGRKEAAIKSFQEVCRRYPKSEHASHAHAHLQNEYKISATLGGATEEK